MVSVRMARVIQSDLLKYICRIIGRFYSNLCRDCTLKSSWNVFTRKIQNWFEAALMFNEFVRKFNHRLRSQCQSKLTWESENNFQTVARIHLHVLTYFIDSTLYKRLTAKCLKWEYFKTGDRSSCKSRVQNLQPK